MSQPSHFLVIVPGVKGQKNRKRDPLRISFENQTNQETFDLTAEEVGYLTRNWASYVADPDYHLRSEKLSFSESVQKVFEALIANKEGRDMPEAEYIVMQHDEFSKANQLLNNKPR